MRYPKSLTPNPTVAMMPVADSSRWHGTCVPHRYIGMLTLKMFLKRLSAPWAAYATGTFESVDPVGVILPIWKYTP